MVLLYLCIVNLREEIYAPTRKNLRAHGGGEISIEMRQRERFLRPFGSKRHPTGCRAKH